MAEVVRFADIKERVLATQAKLNAASGEGREINSRLLHLLEAVEKTLLYNQKKIYRLRRAGLALVLFGLLGWFAAAALVVERMYGVGPDDSPGVVVLAGRDGMDPVKPAPVDRAANDAASKISSSPSELKFGDAERAAIGPSTLAIDAQFSVSAAAKIPDVDDLVTEPHDYQGRDVEVTGSVVRLFNRYRLRSETGPNTIVLDIDGIRPGDRAKLEAAIEEASLLVPLRARIKGKVERQSSSDFSLVASELLVLDSRVRPVSLGRDRQG